VIHPRCVSDTVTEAFVIGFSDPSVKAHHLHRFVWTHRTRYVTLCCWKHLIVRNMW